MCVWGGIRGYVGGGIRDDECVWGGVYTTMAAHVYAHLLQHGRAGHILCLLCCAVLHCWPLIVACCAVLHCWPPIIACCAVMQGWTLIMCLLCCAALQGW